MTNDKYNFNIEQIKKLTDKKTVLSNNIAYNSYLLGVNTMTGVGASGVLLFGDSLGLVYGNEITCVLGASLVGVVALSFATIKSIIDNKKEFKLVDRKISSICEGLGTIDNCPKILQK